MKKILFFLTITSLICCKTKNIQQSNSSSQIVDMNIINEDKEKIDYKIRTILLHKKNDNLSFSEFELAWTNLGKNTRHISHHWGGEKKKHPTQKPLDVILWCMGIIKGYKNILDPFLGSGSTLIACEKTNRVCYGMELDPHYCDVIINRWEQYTGKKARLVNGST